MPGDVIKINGFLVIRSNGEIRFNKRRSNLRLDEIAFPLTVSIPRQWGRVQLTRIEILMPEPPEAWVEVGDGEGVAVVGDS